ncbi:MAG TPA: hypothetical protein VHN79_11570, partial [Lacunisphaera sp.]|nr:hypothetical protein [Lacunisphaera sp.]
DVYVSQSYAKAVQIRLRDDRSYQHITVPPGAVPALSANGRFLVDPMTMAGIFGNIRPMPYEADFQFGTGLLTSGFKAVLSVHPNADIWLVPPGDAVEIAWGFGIFPGAYENPKAHTDGVEFIIEGELPDGRTREVYRRLLDPAQNAADRGDQQAAIPYTPLSGEKLQFSTRPNAHSTFDWAYIINIRVR